LVNAPAPDISTSHLAADNHSLVDAPVPDISASVITPAKYVAPPQKEAKTGVLSTIKSFRDWLYVPEQIKKPIKSLPEQIKKPINKALEQIKKPIKSLPEQIKKPINKALEALKTKVAQLFGKINEHKFVLYESESALKGLPSSIQLTEGPEWMLYHF